MELTAAVKGLEALKNDGIEVDLFTDSKYLCDGMNKWIKTWQKNNWKNSKKEEVKNKEQWLALNSLVNKYKVNFIWVKAHNGNVFNEEADKAASDEANKRKLGNY